VKRKKIIIIFTLLFIIPNFSLAQGSIEEIKKVLEKVSRPGIEGTGWHLGGGEYIRFFQKQPPEIMLPICKDLLYGEISKYNLTDWGEGKDFAIDYYRLSAAYILRYMKKPEALSVLREWIEKQKVEASERTSGLKAVIEAIGEYGEPEDAARLQRWAKHPYDLVRYSAVMALGNINYFIAIHTLKDVMLYDPNLGLRIFAIKYLKNYGDESILPDLKRFYEDPNIFPDPFSKKIIKETIEAIENRLKEKTKEQK